MVFEINTAAHNMNQNNVLYTKLYKNQLWSGHGVWDKYRNTQHEPKQCLYTKLYKISYGADMVFEINTEAHNMNQNNVLYTKLYKNQLWNGHGVWDKYRNTQHEPKQYFVHQIV